MMRDLIKLAILAMGVMLYVACKEDDKIELVDNRSIITNNEVDYLIGRNGDVSIIVSGGFSNKEYSLASVQTKGFVYGLTPEAEVNTRNVIELTEPNQVKGEIENLLIGEIYFIRGYFKMSDGTYFYGNEIQVSTMINERNVKLLKLYISLNLIEHIMDSNR